MIARNLRMSSLEIPHESAYVSAFCASVSPDAPPSAARMRSNGAASNSGPLNADSSQSILADSSDTP